MSTFLTEKCFDKLKQIHIKTGISYSSIANKAVRKWNKEKNKPETILRNKKDEKLRKKATTLSIKEELKKNKTTDEIRFILEWFLDIPRDFKKPVPLYIDLDDMKALYKISNGIELAKDYLMKTEGELR